MAVIVIDSPSSSRGQVALRAQGQCFGLCLPAQMGSAARLLDECTK